MAQGLAKHISVLSHYRARRALEAKVDMVESNVTACPEKGTECVRLQGDLDEDEALVALVHQRSDEQRPSCGPKGTQMARP